MPPGSVVALISFDLGANQKSTAAATLAVSDGIISNGNFAPQPTVTADYMQCESLSRRSRNTVCYPDTHGKVPLTSYRWGVPWKEAFRS